MGPLVRIEVVVVVMAIAMAVAWVARRGVALRRRRASLPPSVRPPVLFTSETCATCSRARRILADANLPEVTEIVWEKHPDLFSAAAIDRVPVFVWADRSGALWRVDGVASLDRMRRWLGDP